VIPVEIIGSPPKSPSAGSRLAQDVVEEAAGDSEVQQVTAREHLRPDLGPVCEMVHDDQTSRVFTVRARIGEADLRVEAGHRVQTASSVKAAGGIRTHGGRSRFRPKR
jgi:hypothetical protein